MDQNKKPGQQPQQQSSGQGTQKQHAGTPPTGQEEWHKSTSAQREPAEGGRTQQMPGGDQPEPGRELQGERNRGSAERGREERGGITNRSHDEEMHQQERLPERGKRGSER